MFYWVRNNRFISLLLMSALFFGDEYLVVSLCN